MEMCGGGTRTTSMLQPLPPSMPQRHQSGGNASLDFLLSCSLATMNRRRCPSQGGGSRERGVKASKHRAVMTDHTKRAKKAGCHPNPVTSKRITHIPAGCCRAKLSDHASNRK
jgi:hypothetical protein